MEIYYIYILIYYIAEILQSSPHFFIDVVHCKKSPLCSLPLFSASLKSSDSTLRPPPIAFSLSPAQKDAVSSETQDSEH